MHIIKFMGGFANQLFQLSLYMKLRQQEYDVYAYLGYYATCNEHGGFKLSEFISLNYIGKLPAEYVLINENNIGEMEIDNERNYCYEGYWQDSKYFPTNMSFLDSIFTAKGLSEENSIIYSRINESVFSVSLHVRRGDYISNYLHGNIATKFYYTNSIEYVLNNFCCPSFFVFSDDIEWCEENLDFKGNPVTFVKGNQEDCQIDLLLMSMCKCNIISNSSFSWWAKTLNKHSDKVVISPEYWFNEKIATLPLNTDEAIHIHNYKTVSNTKENPFFSICIPAYNVGIKLRRCMASVLCQSFENIEIIIVDDGSTDDTLALINEYVESDVRIKVVSHEKNQSLLSSRFDAIQIARGEYLLFVDADDYLELDACKRLYEEIHRIGQIDILEFAYVKEPSKQIILSDTIYDDMPKAILERNYAHTIWNKCYSKDVVERSLSGETPFYCNMSEDTFFSVLFFMHSTKFKITESVLYHYTVGDGMSTGKCICENQLTSYLQSINNKNDYLKRILEEKRTDLLESLKYSKEKDVEFIKELCMKSDNTLYSKLGLLKTIDSQANTSYETEFEESLDNILNTYQNLRTSSIRKRVAIICKCGNEYIIKPGLQLVKRKIFSSR